jgi:hypothetical protein
MPDRLERELRALRVQWPRTPDIAAAVEAGSAAADRADGGGPSRAPRRRARPWRARPLAWGLAALVAVVAAGLAASPAARSALLDLLGLRGARVERREPPPSPPSRPGSLGSGLRLGRPATAAQAAARLGFEPTVPASLGTPDAVWLDAPSQGPPRVSLVYARRPGIPRSPHTAVALLLTQFRARATPLLAKTLGAGARLARIAVAGGRAYLIRGAHGFAWAGPRGQFGYDERRIAGTVLLVERGDVLLRAEGRLTRTRASALARELARG